MPPRVSKNVIVFVVDIGLHSKKSMLSNPPTYLDKAKQIMINLIKRMIFINPNDEIGIILYGSNQTKNDFNYKNIEVQNFQAVTWDVIENIQHITSTEILGEFEKAIEVALQTLSTYISENEQYFNYETRRIYYFHNYLDFKLEKRNHDYSNILNKIGTDIEMWYIGEKDLFALKKEINSDSNLGCFINFIESSFQKYGSMDTVIEKSMFVGSKSVKPVPSKVILEYIDIEIPVSMYKMIDDEMNKPKLKTIQSRSTEYLDANKTIVDKNDIIKAYKFGHKLIPVTNDDEEKMKYTGEKKLIKILGFINKDEITIDYWGTSPARLILPNKDCNPEQFTDYFSLCETMARKEDVAIVRVVLRNNDAPKMGFLYSNIDESSDTKLLIFIEMPFEEQKYSQYFKPIPKSLEIYPEISESVQKFMYSTVLMNKKKRIRFFEPGTVRNPSIQVYWDAIAFKIQNPDGNLEELKCSHLFNVLKQPEFVRDIAKKKAENLQKVFETYVKVKLFDESSSDEESIKDNTEESIKLKTEQGIEEKKEENLRDEHMNNETNASCLDDGMDFDDISEF